MRCASPATALSIKARKVASTLPIFSATSEQIGKSPTPRLLAPIAQFISFATMTFPIRTLPAYVRSRQENCGSRVVDCSSAIGSSSPRGRGAALFLRRHPPSKFRFKSTTSCPIPRRKNRGDPARAKKTIRPSDSWLENTPAPARGRRIEKTTPLLDEVFRNLNHKQKKQLRKELENQPERRGENFGGLVYCGKWPCWSSGRSVAPRSCKFGIAIRM